MVLAGSRRLVASPVIAARSVSTFTKSYPSFESALSLRARPAFFEQSFHPSIAASLSDVSTASDQRRLNLLAAVIIAGFVSAYALSSSDSLKLDAPPPFSAAASSLTSITADPSKEIVVDTDTQLSFPAYLPTPASFSTTQPPPRFKLIGLGVRTVSFLRVKVYVAALYIDEAKLNARLTQSSNPDATPEQVIKELLDHGTSAVIRIVPVRNTDFNHLRDGFIRALQNRLKKAIKQPKISTDSPLEAQFQKSIGEIKESFPRGSVPKGSPLDLVIVPTSATKPVRTSLNFEYDGQIFGQVKGSLEPADANQEKGIDAGFTVARELVLAYFADKDEISTPFKRSVQQTLVK
ncbi:uncharacterized protein MEPE_02526 [Melanopsichium pennsylvanicum]|uniref:Chalcone isomerase domain-containing protein n=2 Tax=Melanopsichium pennsylvanicum TaxID=63383 RepID=A0AAJ5C4S1_9BASI|nr:uncharacterized protein MEPE_02526 [Melanopsichium pennsylvanicum]